MSWFRDPMLELAAGQMQGYSHVNKFGLNQGTGDAIEAIWDGGGAYTGFPGESDITEMLSSDPDDTAAGNGARTVEIFGLDDNYLPVSETKSLNGATPVVLDNQYLRCFRAVVRSAGPTGGNEGVITIRQQGTPANIFVAIIAGYNQSEVACYTVPAGRTAYLLQWGGGAAGKANLDATLQIENRPFGEVFQVKDQMAAIDGRLAVVRYAVPKIFHEKSDIQVRGEIATGSAEVSAFFDLVLR